MTPAELMKLKAQARLRLQAQKNAAPIQPAANSQDAPITASGLLGQAGSSLGKGLVGLAEFPAVAGQWLGEKAAGGIDTLMGISPEEIAKRQAAAQGQMASDPLNPANLGQNVQAITGPFRQPQNTAEKYVDTAMQFAPSALVGGAPGIGMKLASAVAGGLGSEAAGQAAQIAAPEAEPYARLAGALLAGSSPSMLRRAITPLPISPERTALVDSLRHEGVDLTAGQTTGSNTLRYAESELGGASARHFMENQGEQFTHAALTRAGIDAPRATPEVMDHAFTRIGNQFQNLAARNNLPPDARLATDVASTVTDYAALVPAASRAPIVQNLAQDLVNAAQHGMAGDAYNSITSRLARMARNNKDPQLADALREMRHSLDNAMERHLTATNSPDLPAWREARNQYRNMIVLEKAASGSGENAAQGLISPSALRNATVVEHGRRSYVRGQGDFADLARAGEATMKPLPQSGTAPRTAVRAVGTSIPTILGVLAGSHAGTEGAILGGMAGAAVPSAVGKLLLSKLGRGYLGNQLLPGRSKISPTLVRALIAAQSNPVQQADGR